MDFENKLEYQVRKIISTWDEPNIYAISFLVTMNQSSTYRGICNFPEFSIGYNTENDCKNADLLSEDRWNFAYWSQNNISIIDENNTENSDELIKWYEKQGVVDIGLEEAEENMYDDNCNYIGKGPSGYWELLALISNIAKKLQIDGTLRQQFGSIPIIVHDLEYCWYTFDMTKNANPHGEAEVFLKYLKNQQTDFEEDE